MPNKKKVLCSASYHSDIHKCIRCIEKGREVKREKKTYISHHTNCSNKDSKQRISFGGLAMMAFSDFFIFFIFLLVFLLSKQPLLMAVPYLCSSAHPTWLNTVSFSCFFLFLSNFLTLFCYLFSSHTL